MNSYRPAIEQLESFTQRSSDEIVDEVNAKTMKLSQQLATALKKQPDIKARDDQLTTLWWRAWRIDTTNDRQQDLFAVTDDINATQAKLHTLRYDGLEQLTENIHAVSSLKQHRELAKVALSNTLGEQLLNALSAVPLIGYFVTAITVCRIAHNRINAASGYQQELANAAELLRYLETLELIEHVYIPKLDNDTPLMQSDFNIIDAEIQEYTLALDRIEHSVEITS